MKLFSPVCQALTFQYPIAADYRFGHTESGSRISDYLSHTDKKVGTW